MTTSPDVKKDTESSSMVDMAAEATMGISADMTASEAAATSAVEQSAPNIDVSELHEKGAISDGEVVANEETQSDGSPDTATPVNIARQVNITGKVNLIAHVDASGRVTITGKLDLDGVANLDGLVQLNGQVKLSGEADITGQVVVSLPDTVSHDAVVVTPLARSQHSDAVLFQPANLLRRLTLELRRRIFDLVLADGVPGAPPPIPGEEQFVRTLKLPSITMVDRQTRDEVLAPLLRGKQFSVQLPRDESKIDELETLQERVMNRSRVIREEDAEILKNMKEHARNTATELHEYLAIAQNTDLCPFQHVGSLIVTYNGRFRLNVEDGTSNWSPRSLLVGFRCYDEAGLENWQGHQDKKKRLNAHGSLDWTDFRHVRKAFVAALIKNEFWFSYVPYEDVLLHPMIQHLVKALCIFASSQTKPLRWVEVIACEFIDIPKGLGVEWSYLTYGEAVYQSEPNDGYEIFPDGRFLSDAEDSQDSQEKESSAGEDGEHDENEDEDEDEDEKSSDDANNSEDGHSSEGEDNLADDEKSDGDNIN